MQLIASCQAPHVNCPSRPGATRDGARFPIGLRLAAKADSQFALVAGIPSWCLLLVAVLGILSGYCGCRELQAWMNGRSSRWQRQARKAAEQIKANPLGQ